MFLDLSLAQTIVFATKISALGHDLPGGMNCLFLLHGTAQQLTVYAPHPA